MLIDIEDLLNFIKKLDESMSNSFKIIAVGGTALVLMNLKESTKDVDFCVETSKSKEEMLKTSKKIKSKFKLDIWCGGYIFSQQLPEDYIEKSKIYKKLKNIEIRTLNPLDIILTKVARLNQRDVEDIETLIKSKKINKKELIERYKIIKETMPGSDKEYETKFKFILQEFF